VIPPTAAVQYSKYEWVSQLGSSMLLTNEQAIRDTLCKTLLLLFNSAVNGQVSPLIQSSKMKLNISGLLHRVSMA
jgi:hypothetical protein